jgi:hypothetical protein
MSRWGKTAAGSCRWFCGICRISGIRKRKDNRERTRLSLFVRWLTSKDSLADVAQDQQTKTRTLYRWFEPLWRSHPAPRIPSTIRILVLDATSVAPRKCTLLIAGDGDHHRPVSWMDAVRESYISWRTFLMGLMQKGLVPSVVVCDGQRGMLKAIHEIWPNAHIQRCIVHVIRQSCAWLTRNPKTRAGHELLLLVRLLSLIRTKRQKRRWIHAFRYWNRRHTPFLKERTYSMSGRWWYTHRKLRGTRSLLRNAIPDLFRFVTDPTIPRTSNHVEGGMNSRLKELFRCHRGISMTKKLALASWYLALRQGQRPTRNVY